MTACHSPVAPSLYTPGPVFGHTYATPRELVHNMAPKPTTSFFIDDILGLRNDDDNNFDNNTQRDDIQTIPSAIGPHIAPTTLYRMDYSMSDTRLPHLGGFPVPNTSPLTDGSFSVTSRPLFSRSSSEDFALPLFATYPAMLPGTLRSPYGSVVYTTGPGTSIHGPTAPSFSVGGDVTAGHSSFSKEEIYQTTGLQWSIYPAGRMAQKRKGGQVRFSNEQTLKLEKTFDKQKYLSPSERKKIAKTLQLTERQVKTWFQNRRAKWRRLEQESQKATKDSSNGFPPDREHNDIEFDDIDVETV